MDFDLLVGWAPSIEASGNDIEFRSCLGSGRSAE